MNDFNYDILNNIIVFLKEIKPNIIIQKLFLLTIEKLSISKGDFFDNNPKFRLFLILLNNEDYSLLNNEINRKFIYWQNNLYTCEILAQKLKDLSIYPKDLKYIFGLLGKDQLL